MKACVQCPWRAENQGKRHFGGFYTKANLRRLWNEVRRGGAPQSCHMTDPGHPDHLRAGCKEGAEPRECPGSVLLVLREVGSMADGDGVVTEEGVRRYLATRRTGLTRSGLEYWLVSRIHLGGVPLVGGPALPDVEEDDGVALPDFLGGRP
jgi:hypothetical protein